MKSALVFSLLLLRGLTSGQDVETAGGATETQQCVPDQCELGALRERLGALEARLGATEAKLKDSESQLLELKRRDSTIVAFSAGAGGAGHIGPFNTDTTMVYRAVRTNTGSAYNQATGIFTAPVSGLYYFTFFYHAGGSKVVSLKLLRNSEVVAEAYDHQTAHDGADNGGNAALLELQKGDQVYIRLGGNTHVWGNDDITTFSGFLVKEH